MAQLNWNDLFVNSINAASAANTATAIQDATQSAIRWSTYDAATAADALTYAYDAYTTAVPQAWIDRWGRINDGTYGSYYEIEPNDISMSLEFVDRPVETCMCDRANHCKNRRLFSNSVNPCTNCVHNIHRKTGAFDNFMDISHMLIDVQDLNYHF